MPDSVDARRAVPGDDRTGRTTRGAATTGEDQIVAQLNPIAALTAECDALDEVLAGLSLPDWNRQTPAPGWTISHQVAHLAATFALAGLAAEDPVAFKARLTGLSQHFDTSVQQALQPYLNDPPDVLMQRWQAERTNASAALAAVAEDELVPWLVNPLPPGVLAMAGMMEVFAHGQDIADALGLRPERTDRIRFLVEFAVRTWTFGYLARNLEGPQVEFRYELTGPSGRTWTYGPEDATDRITGSAEDFCLLVTRRRHRADLDVTAAGEAAEHWMDIAQCYRGPAGAGRRPGQFTR
ncbi:MAG TPA: TIGR03084 family metal-binding protein [Jatrophihabitans sp.]|nr:TIGR03084 family metal-binding protein [Jatrophihabitans sp.]